MSDDVSETRDERPVRVTVSLGTVFTQVQTVSADGSKLIFHILAEAPARDADGVPYWEEAYRARTLCGLAPADLGLSSWRDAPESMSINRLRDMCRACLPLAPRPRPEEREGYDPALHPDFYPEAEPRASGYASPRDRYYGNDRPAARARDVP